MPRSGLFWNSPFQSQCFDNQGSPPLRVPCGSKMSPSKVTVFVQRGANHAFHGLPLLQSRGAELWGILLFNLGEEGEKMEEKQSQEDYLGFTKSLMFCVPYNRLKWIKINLAIPFLKPLWSTSDHRGSGLWLAHSYQHLEAQNESECHQNSITGHFGKTPHIFVYVAHSMIGLCCN